MPAPRPRVAGARTADLRNLDPAQLPELGVQIPGRVIGGALIAAGRLIGPQLSYLSY